MKGRPASDHRVWDLAPDEVDHGKSAAQERAGLDVLAPDEAGPEREEDQGGSAEFAPTTPDLEVPQDAQQAVRPWKAWGPAAAADHPDEGGRRSADPAGSSD